MYLILDKKNREFCFDSIVTDGRRNHATQSPGRYCIYIGRPLLNFLCDDLSLLPFLLCLSKISYTVYIAEGEDHSQDRPWPYQGGRLAMLGLLVLSAVSTVYQTPILDIINAGVGGLLFLN